LNNKDARYSNFEGLNKVSYLKGETGSNFPDSKQSDQNILKEQ